MEVEQIRKQLQELNPQLGDVIEFYWVGAVIYKSTHLVTRIILIWISLGMNESLGTFTEDELEFVDSEDNPKVDYRYFTPFEVIFPNEEKPEFIGHDVAMHIQKINIIRGSNNLK